MNSSNEPIIPPLWVPREETEGCVDLPTDPNYKDPFIEEEKCLGRF